MDVCSCAMSAISTAVSARVLVREDWIWVVKAV